MKTYLFRNIVVSPIYTSIFLVAGLHIENLESNVSEADPWLWLGRQKDVDAVAELLSSAGRLVSITGTMGIGKSALAIAVAAKLRDQRFLAPFVVDCSGCQDIHSLHVRLMSLWDLHFTQNQMNHFYNWLNSHEQRLLVVFDNFEGLGEEQSAGESEKREISEYLDGLLENVKNLRVLCTGCSNLYCGSASSEVYHLQDLVGHSGDLVSKLAPDLHDEGIQALTEACDHVPIALTLVTRAFMMEDVDSGKLFEDLTLNTDGVFNVESLNDVVEAATKHNNSHKCRYAKLVRCVHILLLNLPDSTQQLLMRMARLSSFDVDVASALTMQKDNKQTVKVVEDLCKVGLLRCDDQERYRMPLLVKLVAKACNQQPQASWNKICTFYMDLIKKLCDQYHSTKCLQSINTFKANYDNIAQVLEFLVQREEIYEKCKDFSNEEYVLFLQSALSPCLYTDVYESLRVHAVDNKDERTHVLALCALALQCLQQEEQHCTALATMEQAYQLLHHWSPAHSTQRAFCLQCLARVRWVTADGQENRNRALVLAKRALDLYKQSTGLRNVRTLYANELYSWMLMKKESFQTARHYYNISDFVVKESLDEHPRLLEGYDCRRAIWDHVCLFARAIEMARKAVDVCQNFYGDHPVTADMWCRLCECIMKRGSLNEAIGAGVRTLAVRVKVLGDHADTAQAYKMLAYLMLRSGQYDEAVRFGQSALDIYDKLTTANIDGSSPPITESQRIDVKNIMSQARYRLEYKSSVFVELESKDASKTQIPGDDISTGGGGGGMIGGTAISTQV